VTAASRTAEARLTRHVRSRVRSWRTGSLEGQLYVLAVLMAAVTLCFAASWWKHAWMPLTAYFVWLLVGLLLLRFVLLAILATYDVAAGIASLALDGPMTGIRAVAVLHLLVAGALVVYQASRQRNGLPGPLSEALLADLRDRLQAQGRVPELPDGWQSQSAMIASHGVRYAGDFLVADLSADRRRLEIVLVDVVGKGTTAGPAALQFAGALGGLLGSLPQPELFRAANAFLLRQESEESFATAVHLAVDLEGGEYSVTSAGHPPALRWDVDRGEWVVDNARGTALGVLADPELDSSCGTLRPGEALLFYTDGVIETRSTHLDVGIAWLQRIARDAIRPGMAGAARRIIRQVERGDDDRAVLIIERPAAVAAAQVTAPGASRAP
jgi:hypothetical protein